MRNLFDIIGVLAFAIVPIKTRSPGTTSVFFSVLLLLMMNIGNLGSK